MEKLMLSPPWEEYSQKVKALFAQDPDITVEYDGKTRTVTLRVETARKADALGRLMRSTVLFGGVALDVRIVPANASGKTLERDAPTADVLLAAFVGNCVVTQIRQVSKGLFRNLCYCVFRRDVVQYPADNLADINGNRTMLMEDIAREVLPNAAGVYFCTSAGADLAASGALDKPLGEWP